MKLSTVQKFGGLSIIAGSFLLTCWAIFWTFLLPVKEIANDFSILVANPNWIWITSLAFSATIFMLFGFTAAYSRMYKTAGIIGFTGFIFIVLAYVIQTGLTSWELFLYPVIINHEPSVFLIRDKIILFSTGFKIYRFFILGSSIFLGVLFFCIALVKGKVFPKISGILIFAGSVTYAISPLLNVYLEIAGIVTLSCGCFLLGLRMITDQSNDDVR